MYFIIIYVFFIYVYLNTYINKYHYVHILGFVSVRIRIILVVVWLIMVIIFQMNF